MREFARAVVGANGAGKSTLVRILSGYYEPDSDGTLRHVTVELTWPINPTELGLVVVHQELAVIDSLSLAARRGGVAGIRAAVQGATPAGGTLPRRPDSTAPAQRSGAASGRHAGARRDQHQLPRSPVDSDPCADISATRDVAEI